MAREDRADHRGVDGTLRWRGTGHGNESGLRVAYFRHPGLAPGSNAPQAPAFMDNWTPAQVRGDDARSYSYATSNTPPPSPAPSHHKTSTTTTPPTTTKT